MENLFKQYDISKLSIAPQNKTEYSDLIKWIAENAYAKLPAKKRYIVVHKKLEAVPLIEVKRWYAIAIKDTNPGFRFNIEFKRWRTAEERSANE